MKDTGIVAKILLGARALTEIFAFELGLICNRYSSFNLALPFILEVYVATAHFNKL